MTIPDISDRASQARRSSPFLTVKQTAFHLGVSPCTLKRLRAAKAGPVCRKHGRAWYYHIADIEAWSDAQRSGRA